jgi:dTDP-4-dehydrorhamnose reductase
MAVFVTGANGLCGSRIVARLASGGERVIAIGRGERRFEQHSNIEYVEQDFLQPAALARLIELTKPAGVINAAAMTDVDACERAPVEAWTLNAELPQAAAHACRKVNARFVHLSTDYVFDGEDGPYGEDDAPNPRGVYARTKRAGEEAALILAPDVAVCRVAVIFSGRKGAKRTFALGVVESLKAGRPVKAFSDQIVSPTLADNAAELVLAVYAAKAQGQGIFHCSGASAVSRIEFCRTLAAKIGADPALIQPTLLKDLKLPAPRPLRCGLRVDKVRALAGDLPLPLDAALDRFLVELQHP